ncbi:hypothetical protein EVAR_61948_1 [Eumeta japonica]|uniref:Uncharacterized protein n=1 Tax=Eumeta variegata TaxID=151549 RepID=A0A4C1ZKP1_EUMVA|nr:hypothetical protein EVAR_61948_1 [Eumeta japonica]
MRAVGAQRNPRSPPARPRRPPPARTGSLIRLPSSAAPPSPHRTPPAGGGRTPQFNAIVDMGPTHGDVNVCPERLNKSRRANIARTDRKLCRPDAGADGRSPSAGAHCSRAEGGRRRREGNVSPSTINVKKKTSQTPDTKIELGGVTNGQTMSSSERALTGHPRRPAPPAAPAPAAGIVICCTKKNYGPAGRPFDTVHVKNFNATYSQ